MDKQSGESKEEEVMEVQILMLTNFLTNKRPFLTSA